MTTSYWRSFSRAGSIALFVLLTFLAVSFITAGETGGVQWNSFPTDTVVVKKEKKKILVDVYTNWCGWCKKMDREVYGDQRVADYLNKAFISVKLNAESPSTITYRGKQTTETAFAQSFGVSGYPTTLFLEPNGDLITALPGFVAADRFIEVLEFIGESHYKTKSWEEFQTTKRKGGK